jgi:hypothetical protein
MAPAAGGIAGGATPFLDQPEYGGQTHEDDGGAEHPARFAAIHQPAKEEWAENSAKIKTGRDDAEHTTGRAGRGGPAHEHIAGGLHEAEDDARDAHGQDQDRNRQGEGCDEEHGEGGKAKADGRRVAVASDLVGQGAAQEDADGGCGEIGRQSGIGGGEGDLM